jgi:threonine/homoserine efflux transporter RhtA
LFVSALDINSRTTKAFLVFIPDHYFWPLSQGIHLHFLGPFLLTAQEAKEKLQFVIIAISSVFIPTMNFHLQSRQIWLGWFGLTYVD